MYSLERAVEQVSRWPSNKDKDRSRLAGMVDELVGYCQQAKKLWQGYQASPGAPGDKFALMSWIGSARANQLHEINLKAKDTLLRLAEAAGPAAGRFANLDDDIIEMAYRQLQSGETGADAAKAAIARIDGQMAYLGKLRQQLLTAKSKPAPDARPAAGKKKPAAKKPPGKKKGGRKKDKKDKDKKKGKKRDGKKRK